MQKFDGGSHKERIVCEPSSRHLKVQRTKATLNDVWWMPFEFKIWRHFSTMGNFLVMRESVCVMAPLFAHFSKAWLGFFVGTEGPLACSLQPSSSSLSYMFDNCNPIANKIEFFLITNWRKLVHSNFRRVIKICFLYLGRLACETLLLLFLLLWMMLLLLLLWNDVVVARCEIKVWETLKQIGHHEERAFALHTLRLTRVRIRLSIPTLLVENVRKICSFGSVQ